MLAISNLTSWYNTHTHGRAVATPRGGYSFLAALALHHAELGTQSVGPLNKRWLIS